MNTQKQLLLYLISFFNKNKNNNNNKSALRVILHLLLRCICFVVHYFIIVSIWDEMNFVFVLSYY